MLLPDIYKALEHQNDFPALDFKFENSGSEPELITRIVAHVTHAKLDISPCLEYSIECENGNLMLFVYNHGWGGAKNFNAEVDLNCFGKALSGKEIASLSCAIIEDGLMQDGYYSPVRLELINKNEVDEQKLPSSFRTLSKWKKQENKEMQYQIDGYTSRESGIPPLSAICTFEDEEGNKYREVRQLIREQHGAYDWRVIRYADEGFVYVNYDGGVRYSLHPPSCTYHFLLDQSNYPSEYEISVAHDVPPKGFERIWLVIGAEKSGLFQLNFTFVTNTRRQLVSPMIDLHIWNPRNAFFHHRHFRGRFDYDQADSDSINVSSPLKVSYSPSRLERYDIQSLRGKRNKSWGY